MPLSDRTHGLEGFKFFDELTLRDARLRYDSVQKARFDLVMKWNCQPNCLVTDPLPCPHMRASSSSDCETMFPQYLEDVLPRNLSRKLTQDGDRYTVTKSVSLKER